MTDRQIWLTPEQVHTAEQRWAMAKDMLETNLTRLRVDIPHVADASGNSDPSMVFDWMWAQIMQMEMTDPNAHKFTVIMCAAAFVELALPRTDDPLTQLEKEVNDDNDSGTT
jgi:hypothetical protein